MSLGVAEQIQFRQRVFGAFDFDVTARAPASMAAARMRSILFNTAVEAAVVLVTAAGGEDCGVGVQAQKLADDGDAFLGRRQVVEAEFQEALALAGLAARLFEKALGVGETECDADAREGRASRHAGLRSTKEYHAGAGAPA